MKRTGLTAVFASIALALSPAGADASNGIQDHSAESGTVNADTGIRVPAGFTATVFAELSAPVRHMAIGKDGTVYASFYKAKAGEWVAVLKDQNGDGVSDSTAHFGSFGGTGIALYDDYLYVSSDTVIGRYKLDGSPVPEGEPEIIVSGFPAQNQHATKPMVFDGKGHMYVTVGAPSNACQERARTPGSPGLMPCPQLDLQAGIWRFDAQKPGQVHGEDGTRYATGIRNGLALDWNGAANALYVISHGRDQLNQLFPQYYTVEQSAELPAEEFHRVDEGSDLGWPYSYWNHIEKARIKAPEYGGDGTKQVDDGSYPDPLTAFPGHWAPNDLLFYSGTTFPELFHNGAFIAFHGSWNRAPLPQQGYNVAFIPMDKDGTVTGDPIIFADHFKGMDVLSSPRAAKHRPTGLAVGPDGALYVADDAAGYIWKIRYDPR